jgi:hypothetical protein
MRIRPSLVVLVLIVVGSLVAAGCTSGGGGDAPQRARGSEEVDEGFAEELQEQAEKTRERLEALEAARRAGTLGVIERVVNAPAPGWLGERIVNETGNDWEPAIAADPNAPFLYVLLII